MGGPGRGALVQGTIAEKDMKNNLYKLWNRMSSGAYFPPPVRTVEIPKDNGGKRRLGIPTVADRIAQSVVKMYLEPLVEPHFHRDSCQGRLKIEHFRRLNFEHFSHWVTPTNPAFRFSLSL